MMFRGAYTDTFYRALHDYLHALADSWNPAKTGEAGYQDRSRDLWNHVVALEKVCRNSYPTVLSESKNDSLVQVRAFGS
jgi:hypothetical protein